MTDDKPRARTRGLLNLTARLLAGHDLSGYTPRQVAEAVVAATVAIPPRRVPAGSGPAWGWRDGRWTDLNCEEIDMRVSEMMPGKYLTAEGIKDRPLLLTIDAIRLEKMGDGKDKWVMSFREVTEGLVLNKTNLTTLAEIFGDETDDWERQKIVLYAARCELGGKPVLGIRVRLPKQQRPAGKPAPPVTQRQADMDDDEFQAMNDDDLAF